MEINTLNVSGFNLKDYIETHNDYTVISKKRIKEHLDELLAIQEEKVHPLRANLIKLLNEIYECFPKNVNYLTQVKFSKKLDFYATSINDTKWIPMTAEISKTYDYEKNNSTKMASSSYFYVLLILGAIKLFSDNEPLISDVDTLAFLATLCLFAYIGYSYFRTRNLYKNSELSLKYGR